MESVQDILHRLGTFPYGSWYTNQHCHSLRYGNAVVEVQRQRLPSGDLRISIRREGDPLPESTRQTVTLPADGAGLRELVNDVLSTGRTLEVGKGVDLRHIGWEMRGGGVDESWDWLAERLTDKGLREPLNLNPDYQRGAVWDEDRQRKYIGFCLEGGTSPPIYIYRPYNSDVEDEEVVDGQQRIRAIARFIHGEIPGDVYIPGEGYRELWYKDFNEIDRRSSRLSIRVVYGDWSRKDRLKFYLRFNSGGVAHTEEELDRVRALLIQEG